EVWERDLLPRRVGAYSPTWIDSLCAGGELVWIGAGALGRHSGKVALYFRDDVRWLGPPPNRSDPPSEPLHDAIRSRLERGASFWTDLIADVAEVDGRAVETVGTARRGYFVEGLGGAQFALPAAIERLRGLRSDEPAGALVLAATDPANPYGASLPWPQRPGQEGSRGGRRPARVPGAYVVT